MRIVYIITALIMIFSVSVVTSEISTTPLEELTIEKSGTALTGERQAGSEELLETVINKLEKLEDQFIGELSDSERAAAQEIIQEVYAMLSFISSDTPITTDQESVPEWLVEVLNNDLTDEDGTEEIEGSDSLDQELIQTRIPMKEDNYINLLNSVRNERFWDDQIRIIRLSAMNSYYNVDQIIGMLGLFTFFEDQQEVLRVMYPRVADPENAYRIPNAFHFYSDRYAVEEIIINN